MTKLVQKIQVDAFELGNGDIYDLEEDAYKALIEDEICTMHAHLSHTLTKERAKLVLASAREVVKVLKDYVGEASIKGQK